MSREGRESEHLIGSRPGALGDTGCHCRHMAGLGSGALNRIEMVILAHVQEFIQLPPSSVMLDADELKDVWLCRQRSKKKIVPIKSFSTLAFLA